MYSNTECKTRTSTEQAPEQAPEQVPEQAPEQVTTQTYVNQLDINLCGELQKRLISAIGLEKRSIKELLDILHLRHRPNFIEYHLRPALEAKLIVPLYPNNINHPRQKYLLTIKGMMLFNQLSNK